MKSYEVKLELEKLMSVLKDAETGYSGYLLYNDESYLETFNDSRASVDKSFSKIKDLTLDNATQQRNLIELNKLIALRYFYLDVYKVKKNRTEKYFVQNSKKSMEDIRKKASEMSKLEDYLLEKREQYFNDTSYYTPFYALLIVIITLFLIVLAYIKITKDLNNLKKSNNRLLVINESQKLAEIISKFGSWQLNFDKNVYTFSDNLYILLGYEPQEFEANLEGYLKNIHPDDLALVKSKTEHILEKRELPNYTYRIIKKNGEIRYFQATGISIKNNFGEDVLVGTTQDVTEQQEYNERIQRSNEDLIEYNQKLTIYDESSRQAEILGKYGSWTFNFDTQKFSFSDNKFRLLGFKPQSFEPTFEKKLEFVHPDDRHIVADGNERIMNEEELPAMTFRIVKTDGEVRHFRTTAKIYIDSLGSKNMIGTTQDITDDVMNNHILNQKNMELERSNKELIEFNYAASHDLQEPLRKIQTFISRVNDSEKDNLSEKGKEYLARIIKASTRMRILIDDLLQYSRTNKSDAIFEDIDLNETLQDVTSDLSEIIVENNTIINTPVLPHIKGIPYQVNQLFVNVIGNSIKYRKANEDPIITITYEKVKTKDDNIPDEAHSEFHKIVFKDNGIGFEAAYAERIFLLFNRLHAKSEYPGTGVGLAICKKIISNHNGYIKAIGRPNEGASVIIYIPVLL
ncbi:PAS domain-containing protein [Flavobacterium ardleyense]